MRNLSLSLALVVGMFGFSSNANAGIVDIKLYTYSHNGFNTGDVTIRTDVGINLITATMNFHDAVGLSFNFFALVQPQPNVNPGTSLDTTNGVGDKIVQANPPAVAGQFIQTGGVELRFGNLANPEMVTGFDCATAGFECAGLFGGGVVDSVLGDITNQTSYIPEPSVLALLGLGLAGMAFARRHSPNTAG